MRRMLSYAVVVAFAALALAPVAGRAQDYPAKPVHLVVPFPPGGGTDGVARAVSTGLAAALGQPVIVENRPGAGGLVAWGQVAKAAPDGYTLVMIANNLRVYKLMKSNLAFDPDTDLVPVATVASVPIVLVGSGRSPADDIGGLVAAGKRAPGTINYGMPGMGSPHHLAYGKLAAETGVRFTLVPYKGTAPLMGDLLGEQIEVAFLGLSSALPHLKSGRLKAYGVAAPRRSPLAPEVQTLAERGGPSFDGSYWYAIAVPKGTPQPVIERLGKAIGQVVAEPAVQANFAKRGFEPMPGGAGEAAQRLADEVAKWSRAVAEQNIRLD